MSKSCWIGQLAKKLACLKRDKKTPRLAVVGIGSEIAGDDAAGVLILDKMRKNLSPDENILLITGGQAPESYSGVIRRFNPEVVLFIDAADMEAEPGMVELLAMEDLDGLSASTHTMPPSILAEYLSQVCNCEIMLLGIQPAHIEMDRPMSPNVLAAVDTISLELCNLLS